MRRRSVDLSCKGEEVGEGVFLFFFFEDLRGEEEELKGRKGER